MCIRDRLCTLVVEIEATLNNRPLTYIYDDEEGLSHLLTPADLIYGRQIATMPHQRHWIVISTFQSLTKRGRYHFRLLEGFTKQWRKEYLLGLREYHQNRTVAIEQSIRVADIVVLNIHRTWILRSFLRHFCQLRWTLDIYHLLQNFYDWFTFGQSIPGVL